MKFYTFKNRPPKKGEDVLISVTDGISWTWRIDFVENVLWAFESTEIIDGKTSIKTVFSETQEEGLKLVISFQRTKVNFGTGYFLLTRKDMEKTSGVTLLPRL